MLITGAYYKVLGEKDWKGFWTQTIKSLVFVVVVALLKSIKEYLSSIIYIEWRNKLTQRIHLHYFSDLSYYRLNVMEREKDNYDQRITQDVDTFCRHSSIVLPELIISPFIIAFYTYKTFISVGYIGFVGCVVYFTISTVLNKSLISIVLNWVYLQQKAEGDFRYQHLRVRNNAESIAFQSGSDFEYNKSEILLNKLISVQEKVILREFALKSSVYLFDYLGSIIAFLFLAIPLFGGKYDSLSPTDLSQMISQNTSMIMYLINCFTRVIDTSKEFGTIGGTAHRIGEVLEEIEERTQNSKTAYSYSPLISTFTGYDIQTKHISNIFFKLINVAIEVPKSGRILLNKLNVEMSTLSDMLISGASGTAKTSILRVLKGIWCETNGTVERHVHFDDSKVVLFLPQKSVLTTGSLLEQITYPMSAESIPFEDIQQMKEHIIKLMQFLELNRILERIDNQIDREVDWIWSDCLSPGEQQRIGFLRLFYYKPLLAVLDESTSALSIAMERKIYEKCKELNIVLISCGHRKSLEEYHSRVLRVIKCQNTNDSAENEYTIDVL